ncbi:MAG TPA: hypothetical protein VFB21_16085 [Chthonomonadaceae bacterium]|nr:hypothetical protein [Chthonomonadaceae bacterium]
MLNTTRNLHPRRFTLSTLALTLSLPLTGVAVSLTAAPAQAAITLAEDDSEPGLLSAQKSQIVPITLPADAFRFTGKKESAQLVEALKNLAKQNQAVIGEVEVLLWQDGDAAKKDLPARLEKAGYAYAPKPAMKLDEGTVTLFTAANKAKKHSLLGLWFAQKENLLLVWTLTMPAAKAPAAEQADANAGPSEPEPASKTPSGKVPADLIGDWSWTTISRVNYVDTNTNQLMAPSGMSAKFTFTRDGRYKKFFYVRQRTYSLVSEATTTEEGTVTFGEDSFTMHPEKGHYKGNTGSRLIDRDMTREERKVTTYRWEWRSENGKRLLYIGPDAKSLSLFKRSE